MAMAQNPKMNRKGGGLKAAMGNLGKGKIPPELIAKLMAMRQGGGMPGGMNAQAGPMPQGGAPKLDLANMPLGMTGKPTFGRR